MGGMRIQVLKPGQITKLQITHVEMPVWGGKPSLTSGMKINSWYSIPTYKNENDVNIRRKCKIYDTNQKP